MNKRLSLILKYLLLVFIFFAISPMFALAKQTDSWDTSDAIPYSPSPTPSLQDSREKEEKIIADQLHKHQTSFNDDIIDFDAQKIIKDVSTGSFSMNPLSILNKALSYLFKEISQNADVLIKLIIIVVLCAILKNIKTSFMSESASDIAFLACYVIIVSILLLSFNTAISLGRNTLENMVNFMYSSTPIMISLLVSSGNVASGGILQPLLLGVIGILATIIKNIYIPIIFLSTILSIINNISSKIQISKLAHLLKQFALWSFGLILTIFISMISIQGAVGAVIDGVTSKTVKFAVGSFIPVAGKYLADATDLVISSTLLIKNAAGVAVMLGIIAICAVPLLKMLAMIALYKITSALLEPISDSRITSCINDISNSISFILGINAAASVMFILSISSIIAAGTITQMLR